MAKSVSQPNTPHTIRQAGILVDSVWCTPDQACMSAPSQSWLDLLHLIHNWPGEWVARSPKQSTPSSSPPRLNDDEDWLVRLLLPAFLLQSHEGILHDLHEPTSTSTQLPYSARTLCPEFNDRSARDGC